MSGHAFTAQIRWTHNRQTDAARELGERMAAAAGGWWQIEGPDLVVYLTWRDASTAREGLLAMRDALAPLLTEVR